MGLKFAILMVAMIGLDTHPSFAQHPYDWHKAGSNTRDYEVGQDQEQTSGEKTRWTSALYIKSLTSSPSGFGTLIQKIDAEDYRGERVRMTAYVKTRNIHGDGVGMWMRVDAKGSGQSRVLSFYNMCDRPITGTTEWQKYEIVLDIPRKSEEIFYGLLLHGTGQAWLQDVKFEIVNHKQPLSQVPRSGCSHFSPS